MISYEEPSKIAENKKSIRIGNYDLSWVNKLQKGDANILYIHGMLEDETMWQLLSTQLNKHNAILPRLPWSAQNDEFWGAKGSGDIWLDYLQQNLDTEPDVIIAHSYGCNAVLKYLLEHNVKQPKYLILLTPFYCSNKSDVTWDDFMNKAVGLKTLIRESISIADINNRYCGELLEEMSIRVRDRLGVFGWTEFLNLYLQSPYLNLNEIKSETLIISGRKDSHCPVEDNEVLSRKINSCKHLVLEETGHFPLQTKPDVVLSEIYNFIYKNSNK